MMTTFLYSFQSEWIKLRRSSALWLTLVGGLLIPAIILIARLIRYKQTSQENALEQVWTILFNRCWENMAILVLPVGIILVASLIHQIEYRNNAWKQLLTSPQSLHTIFWSKYLVVFLMLFGFFILLNLGIYLTGVIPALFYSSIPFPKGKFPIAFFVEKNLYFMLGILPILGFQYLMSLHIKNFIVPIGIGFALLVASLIGISWEHNYTLPYNYAAIEYLMGNRHLPIQGNIRSWAVSYFFLATIISYVLFLFKNQDLRLHYGKVLIIVFILNLLWVICIWGFSTKKNITSKSSMLINIQYVVHS
ncbi:MAG: ABC transporter permease [Raineya sp.]|jgi:hypothetical protein|nr:ABC transporter permease [Raineya sp.]